MALGVYYDPIQVLFWYDKPSYYQGEPGVAFWDHMLTVWDEIKVLMAFLKQVEKYVAHIYTDGGKEVKTPTHVKVSQYIVDSTDELNLNLKPSGVALYDWLRQHRSKSLLFKNMIIKHCNSKICAVTPKG